jgi:hypothetical protein
VPGVDVGHGAPGLRDGLRPLSEFLENSGATRRPFLDLAPGLVVTNWTDRGAGIFSAPVQLVVGGELRDVVSVETSVGVLTRAETLLELSSPGLFYVDAGTFGTTTWDEGGVAFERSGLTWDDGAGVDATLYVNLPGGGPFLAGGDPRGLTVIASYGFHYADKGESHPWLGPNLLVSGDCESLTGWTVTSSGAGNTAILDSSRPLDSAGASSIKLISGGTASGFGGVSQSVAGKVAGAMYRLSGTYRTNDDAGSTAFGLGTLALNVLVSDGATKVLYPDGRSADASGKLTITRTGGETRRWLFDFVAPASTIKVECRVTASSALPGFVNVDDLALQRIYRFCRYEPRLDPDSLPDVEVASSSIFFGGKTIGLGSLKLDNSDGALETAFAGLLLHNRSAICYLGGSFADGQEVYRDDWAPAWPARLRNPRIDDESVTLDADDARAQIFDVSIPLTQIGLEGYPNACLNDVGKGLPLHFDGGHLAGINTFVPPRVDKDTTTGYGKYLLIDPTPSLTGILSSFTPSVYAYYSRVKDARASGAVQTGAMQAVAAAGTFGTSTGVFSVTQNFVDQLPSDRTTDTATLIFDFDIGAGALQATLVLSPFASAASLAASLQAAMRVASASADIDVVYSDTTHKYTTSKGAGALNLRPKTGAGGTAGGWQLLGYTANADYTGALSYTSDAANFVDVDRDHALIVGVRGYKDDAAGTITGVANDWIDTRASIAHFLLRQVLGVPSQWIDPSGFYTGHATERAAEGTLCAFLRIEQQTSVRDLLAQLEAGAFANLVISADGRWTWRPFVVGVAAVADFYDRDYLSFRSWRDPEKNVFASARVVYGQRPARGTRESTTARADASVATKWGRTAVLEIKDVGHPENQTAARARAQRFATLAAADPLMIEFAVRSKAAGKLLVGDVVTITRARSMDGPLSAARFRVLTPRHALLTGVSTITAVEDVAF